MGAKNIINRVVRILLLAFAALAFFLYAIGIVANVFGLLEMRRSDDKILDLLQAAGGNRAFVKYASYHDGTIAYAGIHAFGARDSNAVIFVHGSPGSMDACVPFLVDEHLLAHASLYTFDRLGYGNSLPPVAGASLAAQSAQLYALVREISANKNIFVGHSLGCSIIVQLAMEHPEVVDGMVLVAAPIDPELEPSSWWRPILKYPMISIALPHAMRISNIELAPLKKDLEACLPLWDGVRCQVTFIHGAVDKLVPVANVVFGKKVLQNAKNVSEVVLKDNGHFIFWSRREMIADEIVKQLE